MLIRKSSVSPTRGCSMFCTSFFALVILIDQCRFAGSETRFEELELDRVLSGEWPFAVIQDHDYDILKKRKHGPSRLRQIFVEAEVVSVRLVMDP